MEMSIPSPSTVTPPTSWLSPFIPTIQSSPPVSALTPLPPTTLLIQGLGKRAGASNYDNADVKVLLSVFQEFESLEPNDRVHVCSRFQIWADEVIRPATESTSLKEMFDKISFVWKPVGDLLCPADVRVAKNIAKNLLDKSNIVVAGSFSDKEGDGNMKI